ncbi:MAG: SDR family oxidoreductase [Fuerstiella sp.]|nr:SDR family oxidoreductase [Fuerstiella sp.]
MFGSLDGRRIVVTGASTGIGSAIARECAAAGADVVVSYRTSLDEAEEVAEWIRRQGRTADVFAVDLADIGSCDAFVRDCWNSGRVDGVVNNAGADLLTGDMKNADYFVKLRTLLDVDVQGTVRLGRAFGTRLKQQGSGCLLTLGWDQSDRGMEGDSGELFCTAKNAIMGFTRSLAVSLAPEVRVNCIAPGWIQTEWGSGASDLWQRRVLDETPLKRWGQPQDIAFMARFLLSEEAAFVTGQVINVNGGAVR